MAHGGEDYRVKAIKSAINKAGDYLKFVDLQIEHDPAEMVCYTISPELPENISNKLTSVIEKEGKKLGILVSQIL